MKIKNKKNITLKKLLFIIFSFVYLLKLYFYNNYCLNITSSVPKGLYRLYKINKLKRNDIVYIEIPDNAKHIIWDREYLPKHIKYLLKYVKGVPGDLVEVKENKLYINNKFEGNIKKYDSEGNLLISLTEGKFILKEEQYLVLGNDDNSYDSRYFGVIEEREILKKAKFLREIGGKK